MAGTDITKVSKLGHTAWQIVSPTGATAIVSERGATLLSWQPKPGIELIDSYTCAGELEAADGARSLIMAPWAGPIESATYSFGGRDFEVDEASRAYSLAYQQEFQVISAGTTLSLLAQIEPDEGYPWPVEVSAHFSLDSGADGEEHLSITLMVSNVSDEDAPISLGWHPYVILPRMGTVSNMGVTVPARTKILTDPQGIPLPGESAYAGVNMPMTIEYLGTAKLDDYYRGLVPDDNGVVATRLIDPASNSSIELTQEPGEAAVVHLDTGDRLKRGRRKAIALAPMSDVPDAFNRPDAVGSVRVPSGESRQLTATLTFRA